MIFMANLPIAPVKRIIKENGISRVSDEAAEILADAMEEYAEYIAVEAVKLAKHAGRKTVVADDVKFVLD